MNDLHTLFGRVTQQLLKGTIPVLNSRNLQSMVTWRTMGWMTKQRARSLLFTCLLQRRYQLRDWQGPWRSRHRLLCHCGLVVARNLQQVVKSKLDRLWSL